MTRSAQMARVRGRDTEPELTLRRMLWKAGLRFRVGLRVLRSRPDVVFPRLRVAVFVDGCFWHGCPEHYVRPRTSTAFWSTKLVANVERDRRSTRALSAAGWRVVRLWECDVLERPAAAVAAISSAIAGQDIDRPGLRVLRVEVIDGTADLERRLLVDLHDDCVKEVREGPRNSRSGGPGRRHGR